MRGTRSAVMITVYLLLLAAVVWLVYQAQTGESDLFTPPAATQTAEIGRTIFQWVVFFLSLLLLFIVPAITAGSLAGERERDTLVPLQVSLLTPRSILAGKVGASIAFLAVLVLATLPFLVVAFVIGGVTVGQVAAAGASTLALCVLLAVVCVACSAFFGRVQTATVAAYGAVALLVGGSFFVFAAAGIVDRARGPDPADPPVSILAPNPLVAVADAVADDAPGSPVDTPLSGLRDLSHREDAGRAGKGGPPFWLTAFATQAGIAAAAAVVAIRRLRAPSERGS